MESLMPSNSSNNRYGAIASEIYDIDKPFGKLRDTAFYIDAVSGVVGPILEPACGSGRALVPLAEAGHEMWGFDSSPDMLERARARCENAGVTADLSLQSFEGFTYGHPFEAVILPVASFTLISDAAVARAVLSRLRNCLTTGGLIVFDVTPLSSLADTRDDRRQWTAANGDLLTLENIRHGTDWAAQRADHTIRYERWRETQLVTTELEMMTQRHWGLEEMQMALTLAGFADIECCADYRPGRLPDTNSRIITWQARRL
jgi:SAM-dependent methyltransferase